MTDEAMARSASHVLGSLEEQVMLDEAALQATCAACDLTMTNIVHPSTVHREHLCGNPTGLR